MRRTLPILLALAAAAPACARGADLSSRDDPADRSRWGVAVAAGFPDFATASAVFRPLPWARLHAGPAWNYAGWGLQGGVTLAPWSFPFTPTLTVQAGRYFASDLSFIAGNGDAEGMKPLLKDVGYSWAAADVGIEVGSPRGLVVSLRVGLSYLAVSADGTATHTNADGSTVTLRNPSIVATLPSVKLGVQHWF